MKPTYSGELSQKRMKWRSNSYKKNTNIAEILHRTHLYIVCYFKVPVYVIYWTDLSIADALNNGLNKTDFERNLPAFYRRQVRNVKLCVLKARSRSFLLWSLKFVSLFKWHIAYIRFITLGVGFLSIIWQFEKVLYIANVSLKRKLFCDSDRVYRKCKS